jgi:WXG100 family type VII secretion target
MAGQPVIIDPEELDNFARQLGEFNSNLAEEIRRLTSSYKRLGETWRDPAYQKFAQEFEQTINNLRRFQKIAEETTPKLKKTASLARQVHQ